MFSLGFLVFVIITFVITGITLAVFFFYKGIYDRHTTKVLESGVTPKRKWIAPWGLALIVFLAQLMIVLSVFIPASLFMTNKQSKVVELSMAEHPSLDYSWEPYSVYDGYSEVKTTKSGTVTFRLLKRENADNTVDYILTGEAEISKMDSFNMAIDYVDNDSHLFSESLFVNNEEKKDVVYFKFETQREKDKPGKIDFSFGEGPDISKNVDKLTFDL